MPTYKLSYYNLMGRGEPIRWIFAYANKKYEDERFDRDLDWPTRKPNTPYGKTPTLYIDGKYLYSSTVICRYLGRTFDLMPEDPYQQAVCDEVVDGLNDCFPVVREIIFAKVAGKTEESTKLGANFLQTIFPPIAKAMEGRLQNNEWFGGNKISWADIYMANIINGMSQMSPHFYDNSPKLKALVERVMAQPSLVKWIKDRPQTAM